MNITRQLIVVAIVAANTVFPACKKDNKSSQKEQSTVGKAKDEAQVLAIQHPGMLHTAADFTRMIQKVNANAEPWKSGWNKLLANPHSSSTYALQGPTVYIIRGSSTLGGRKLLESHE